MMLNGKENIGSKATKGAIWATIDRFGSMGIQFLVNLLLARILLPEDFGIIGMLAIFIAVSNTLVDAGFANALIQKKNPTELDYSTVFFWNIGISIVLYSILFIISPYVANFFSMPSLSGVLRGIGVYVIIAGILNVQNTRLRKQLKFNKIAILSLSSYSVGAIAAVLMAKNGCGVWSLVGLQLITGFINIILYYIVTRWLPLIKFSISSFKQLFSFGSYMMAASILQDICKNLQGVIIGKKFSATDMGYYSQAYKLDNVISASIPQVLVQVMYPVYSSLQDDKLRLKNMMDKNVGIISFFIYPLLSLMIFCAYPLIVLLYGDKWIPSVPYYQLLCIGGFFTCLQNINFIGVAAIGKSKPLFHWSFYKWSFLIVVLVIGMTFGMDGIIIGMVISNINVWLVNASLVSKYINWSLIEQIKCLIPVCISCIAGLTFAYSIYTFFSSYILSCLSFFIIYNGIAIIFKIEAYLNAKKLLIQLLTRNK